MNWYDILSLVISVLSLGGFGVVMKHFWDDRHARKIAHSKEETERRKTERQAEIRAVIQEEISPIKVGVDEIIVQLKKSTKGTVLLLRGQMKTLLDNCKERGWASETDKANFNELYETYGDLGGNHFKNYVDAWKETMDNLPEKLQTKEKIQINE